MSAVSLLHFPSLQRWGASQTVCFLTPVVSCGAHGGVFWKVLLDFTKYWLVLTSTWLFVESQDKKEHQVSAEIVLCAVNITMPWSKQSALKPLQHTLDTHCSSSSRHPPTQARLCKSAEWKWSQRQPRHNHYESQIWCRSPHFLFVISLWSSFLCSLFSLTHQLVTADGWTLSSRLC